MTTYTLAELFSKRAEIAGLIVQTEKQVRQFLATGNLLPSDLARLNKNTEWSTVEHILAVSAVLATLPLPVVKPTAKMTAKPAAKPVKKAEPEE